MGNHIVECAQDGASNANTGANKQCPTSPTVRYDLATLDQEFTDTAEAKDKAAWVSEIALKNIIPTFLLEELENSDTEDTYKEGNERYRTKVGQKIRKCKLPVGVCSHAAIKSYHNKTMRVYEHCNEGELKATTPDGVKIKGQKVRVEVGKLVDALNDNFQYTPLTLYFSDYNEFENSPVVLRPDWSYTDIFGIFDAKLTLVSASATSLKFKVGTGCDYDDVVKSLLTADVTLKNRTTGVAKTHSFVAADANGVYELTGTGFDNTLDISLDGVVTKTDISYEAIAPLPVTGIA